MMDSYGRRQNEMDGNGCKDVPKRIKEIKEMNELIIEN